VKTFIRLQSTLHAATEFQQILSKSTEQFTALFLSSPHMQHLSLISRVCLCLPGHFTRLSVTMSC